MSSRRRRLCAASLLAPLLGVHLPRSRAQAETTVGDALDRPSTLVRRPDRVMLQAAAYTGSLLVAVGERGVIAHSSDEGGSWQQVLAPTSVTLTAVGFRDALHGLAVGHGGIILGTDDGGRTWQKRTDGLQAAQAALIAARKSGRAEVLARAQTLVDEGPDKPLFVLHRFGAARTVALGAYGAVLQSRDEGRTWDSAPDWLDNPKGLHLYTLRARAQRVLIAGEQGLVLLSDDGGNRFRRIATPYKGTFFTAELGEQGGIWLAGLRGNAWHSADDGVTWEAWKTPAPANLTHSLQIGGQPILASQAGQLLRPQGGSFVSSLSTPLPPINSVLALREGGLLALTVNGAMTLSGAQLSAISKSFSP